MACPNFKEEFRLFVDASLTGIGFTRAQNQNEKELIIAYNCRGLNQTENNSSTTEREAVALLEEIETYDISVQ